VIDNECRICHKLETCLFSDINYVCKDCYEVEKQRQMYDDIPYELSDEIWDKDGD